MTSRGVHCKRSRSDMVLMRLLEHKPAATYAGWTLDARHKDPCQARF